MTSVATKVLGKKILVDWQQGIKVISMVKPDLKKSVQDAVTRNSDLQRALTEAQEARPRLAWDNYERLLTSASDKALLHDVIQKIEQFQATPINTASRQSTLASEGQRLVSHLL